MTNTLKLQFGITNEYELFEKLKRDLHKLLSEALNTQATIDNTFNYLITAFHLSYDWTKDDKYKEKKESIPQSFKNLLTAIQFLANSSKHRELTKFLDKNTVEDVTEPSVGNYYDYMYGDQILQNLSSEFASGSILKN